MTPKNSSYYTQELDLIGRPLLAFDLISADKSEQMGENRNPRLRGRWRALVACLFLCNYACVTAPPYQEMSDARQAVAVAAEAGAAEKTPELFAQAQAYLKNAKEKMDRHSFNIARSQAVLAREKAIEAQRHIDRQSQR